MFSPQWWHWLVLGLLLTMAELAIVSFFVVWFGIAAAVVGLILLAAPTLALPTQLLLLASLSTALVLIWFRYLRPRTMTAVGTSAAAVTGEVGILVADLTPDCRGQVRFQKPILGADVWEAYADAAIAAGERVRVVAVDGSYIKVEKAK
ncbi:MAG: NfeD family protein [Candidatus Accumulibacter sp.]|uniref:NfeD family protein n=1 Tax=Accumulibacter sp. TaxID=2053492 RepID=UPI001B0B864A|nr:NfeD family protein [Accumulibacter sp.]MBO3703576.1 NfeD family protein [Accumulibacter sp.]